MPAVQSQPPWYVDKLVGLEVGPTGAQMTIVDKTAYDGQLNPVTYQRIGEIFTEAQEKRPHFGQQPWQEIGVYYSAASRD